MGQFVPGQSGNPSGRPKADPTLTKAAREHAEAAIAVIVANLADESAAIRQRAAESLLDRGYGKPAQSIVHEGGDDPVKHLHEVIWNVVKPTDRGS